jgi:hypothetical protein
MVLVGRSIEARRTYEWGRVDQSAERVCEQHEMMVRNQSPAANLICVFPSWNQIDE